ncbi:hypothetical protein M3665_27965, partial [Bacillus licheniformis]|nr:hypothetical protein [Bacillus licheniformis]
FVLGKRFSGLVAIQPGHTLVTGGIYSRIRNPSYLGLVVNSLGWALVFRSSVGVLLVVLTLTNLISVGSYGEFEFWFALIKVVAIVVFLCIGGAAIVGIIPAPSVSGVSNLFVHDGFMPHGASAVLAAMLTTMF